MKKLWILAIVLVLGWSVLLLSQADIYDTRGVQNVMSALWSSAANTATIGSSSHEFADLYLGDGGVGYFGNDQDVTLTHLADLGLSLNLNLYNGTGFWDGAPSMANNDMSLAYYYTNDFVGEVLLPTATGVANGWKSSGDATYDVLSAAGTLGGWCLLAPEAGSNNEVYFQMGQLGTETYVECTASSGKEWWLEFNLTPSSVTNAASWFVGLAEEGSAAANFIHDDGDDIADKDAILLGGYEADADSLTAIWQTSGSAFADTLETLITATNMTLGFHFDGVTTLYFYKDGSALGSVNVATATFPAGEELSPIIAMKQGASAININLDWIKLVAER